MARPTLADARELSAWQPPLGVISVYLRFDAGDRGGGWRTQLRNGAERVLELARDAEHGRKVALRATAARLLHRFEDDELRPPPRGELGFLAVGEDDGEDRWWQTGVAPASPTVALAEQPLVAGLVDLCALGRGSGVVLLSADLSALVTVLWVIGMANAVNLIDGLDGLAAGIVGIAAAAFFIYTAQLAEGDLLRPDNPSPLLAAAVVGICVGFLPHNFHPARTFMGDGGALLLGLLMAAATSSVGGQSRAQFSGQTYFFFAPLVIPLFILGVPILDTAFAVLRRARRRSGLATADKGHLHHRLMNLGHGQRRSVLILWGWTAVLSGVALYPTITGKGDGLVLFGLAALALLLYTYFHPGVRAARRSAPAEGPRESYR